MPPKPKNISNDSDTSLEPKTISPELQAVLDKLQCNIISSLSAKIENISQTDLPQIRQNINKLELVMSNTEESVNETKTKVNEMEATLNKYTESNDNHEKRINKLEAKRVASSLEKY